MSDIVKPVILSGGSGTRLWPLSRHLYPKQLLPLIGEKTLLQDTVMRLEDFPDVSDSVTVVCNDAHRFLVAEQLREIDVKADALLLEPVGRNTAPALTLAAIANRAGGHDDILLVMPADHVIQNIEIFQRILTEGTKLAAKGMLVTFGIVPTKAETGYGYIRQGKSIDELGFEIAEFVEKPDAKTAQAYVESGEFLWNSGMFMMKSSVWLAQIGQHAPAILAACETAYNNGKAELDFYRIDEEAFAACPSDSIDYAVAEKITSTSSHLPGMPRQPNKGSRTAAGNPANRLLFSASPATGKPAIRLPIGACQMKESVEYPCPDPVMCVRSYRRDIGPCAMAVRNTTIITALFTAGAHRVISSLKLLSGQSSSEFRSAIAGFLSEAASTLHTEASTTGGCRRAMWS